MTVTLRHRHYGIHKFIKSIDIAGNFGEYCIEKDGDNYIIDERKLIDNLPDGFLPTKSQNILVTVSTDDGSTGQHDLNIFRKWAKYFDSYVLDLIWEGKE